MRITFGLAIGALTFATLSAPVANAEPECTAAVLSNTLGSVSSATGVWLGAHPEADQVISAAGGQGSAGEDAIRQYFVAHQNQWQELQGIAGPLRNLRHSCQVQVAPGDIARLFDAMSS